MNRADRRRGAKDSDKTEHLHQAEELAAAGRLDEAIGHYQQALRAFPDNPVLLNNYANALITVNRVEEALPLFQRALALDPHFALAHVNLGNALGTAGRTDEAIAHCRTALAIDPNFVAVHGLIGHWLTRQGRVAEGLAEIKAAIDADPAAPYLWSIHLIARNYCDRSSAAEIAQSHRQWRNTVLARYPQAARPRPSNPDPERRLKVGYISADLRQHSVAFFFEPLLAAHNRSKFEITCYSNSRSVDTVTRRLKALSNRWRDVAQLSDDALFAQIRADGIDVLVDLSGHTAGNRLPLFVRRPAPVQVTWLGYPNTTGVESFDARLTDAIADPEGNDALYSEPLVRLNRCFLCFRPPLNAPSPSPPPAASGKPLTFGSFNNAAKLSPSCLALWSRVLNAVPESTLLLKAWSLDQEGARQMVLDTLKRHGVAPERIKLMPHTPDYRAHLTVYHEVDICLDTLPYNGTTTSCEALWMGVPVLTLRGERHASRVGATVLGAAGLPELVAADEDEFVAKALALASDLPGLVTRRANARANFAASPLADEKGFARAVEEVYGQLWREAIAA